VGLAGGVVFTGGAPYAYPPGQPVEVVEVVVVEELEDEVALTASALADVPPPPPWPAGKDVGDADREDKVNESCSTWVLDTGWMGLAELVELTGLSVLVVVPPKPRLLVTEVDEDSGEGMLKVTLLATEVDEDAAEGIL
jgi:hypothetical protein